MMTPLFVESQSMSTSVLDESMDDENQLRATQQVQQFTPTQTGTEQCDGNIYYLNNTFIIINN